MGDDKKAIAAMIVAKAKKPEEDDSNPFPSMEGEDAEDEMGLDTAVSDMLSAFQSQDPDLLKEALKSFIVQYKE